MDNRYAVILIILLNCFTPQVIQILTKREDRQPYVPDDYQQDYVRPFTHIGSVAGVSDTTYFA